MGSWNIPSREFATSLPKLVKATEGKERVVFHCTLSQGMVANVEYTVDNTVRGPKAARMFQEGRELLGHGSAAHNKHGKQLERSVVEQNVYILRGGFQGWQAKYGSQPDLTEDWNKEYWDDFLG